MSTEQTAYIYILQDGQDRNTNIYKVGRTAQSSEDTRKINRFGTYSKNTMIHATYKVACYHLLDIEDTIKKCLTEKYTLVRGKEWFQGDVDDIEKDVHDIIQTYKKKSPSSDATNNIINNSNGILLDSSEKKINPTIDLINKISLTLRDNDITNTKDMSTESNVKKEKSPLVELVKKDPSRIKVYKKVNNPNYDSEYYHANKETRKKYQDTNKLKCNVCDINLSLAAKKTHILSTKHKFKLLESGAKLDNPEDCYTKVKIDTEKIE